jgi:hypothetical protein
MSNNNSTQKLTRAGFTIVELLIIAPIVLLTIGAFITAIVNMTGDVLASRGATVLTYNIQDALNRIEDDVKLSTTFLATNNITLTSPQGYSDDTTSFNNVDPTNGTMLILNTLATNGNPLISTSGLVYLQNLPNACNSTQLSQNTPLTLNIVYFVSNGTLWRRTIMPSTYATAGCSVPWQQASCNPALFTNGSWTSYTFCSTQDIRLVDNVTSGGFAISYFNTADATISNTVASDGSSSTAVRNSALQSLSTVGASISVSSTAGGRPISQNGSIRATKLDINASTIAPIVIATKPSKPTVTASVTSPATAVFNWPSVPQATGYYVYYSVNGGSLIGTSWSSTTFTVNATQGQQICAYVFAGNSAGYSSNSYNCVTVPLWATPLVQNGWSDYNNGYTTAGYTKTSTGMVMLKGLIANGSTATNTILFQLPPGYQPATNLIFQNETNPNASGRIDVWSDGTVRFVAGSNAWYSLDNINFMPSGTAFTSLVPTLANGWLTYGNPPWALPEYFVDSDGRLHIDGLVKNGTTTDNTVIATLPSGLTPSLYQHISADGNGANAFIGLNPASNGIVAKGVAASSTYQSLQLLTYTSTRPTTGACTVAWCLFSYQNGWHDYGSTQYATGAYTKGSDNVVELKGLISSSTATLPTVIATLPAGYRPKQRLIIAVESLGANGRLDIDTSGNVIADAGSSGWFSVDGVSFLAEQ